jgi:hypothetical protein|tara:strand:+ start:2292 stop:5066 length:2775 start_codon:yes stop_codon:yes gene_type:complete
MPMMLPPRSAFRAPPVAPVQGIAARGPAAAASATGGVPVITTDQGVNVPAPPRPAGLESLVTNMQEEIKQANPDELIGMLGNTGIMLGGLARGEKPGAGGGEEGSYVDPISGEVVIRGETYPSEDPNRRTLLTAATDEGVLTAAQSGEIPLAKAAVARLNAESPDDVFYSSDGPLIYRQMGDSDPVAYARIDSKGRLVAPDSVPSVVQRRGDDDAPVVTSEPKEIIPSPPELPGNITAEQAKAIARETIGITGKEGEEDAYTALMMFGLGLMATPGKLTEAIGKAGLGVIPQITKARQAQRTRRKDVGMLAYNIRETNKAQRVAASAAQLKAFHTDRTFSLDVLQEQNKSLNAELDAVLSTATPGTKAKVYRHLTRPSFNKTFNQVRTLGQTKQGLTQVMQQNGTSLAQLAVSSAIKAGDITEEDLGQYEDPGWTRYKERDPDRPGWTRSMIYATNRAYAKNPETGAVGYIEPGTQIALDKWAPPDPTTPAVLHRFNERTQKWEQTTESGLEKEAIKEFNESERSVFDLMRVAQEATRLVDEGGAYATSGALSAPGKAASYALSIWKALDPEGKSTDLRDKIKAYASKFTGALDKSLIQDLAKSKTDKLSARGLVLDGENIGTKSGVASWIGKVVDPASRARIVAGIDKKDRAMAEEAFNNFASLNPRLRSLMFNMAYAVGRSEEPGGRLTDRDIANAMTQLGGNKDGNIASPEIFKDVLHQKVRQVARSFQTRARQTPDVTGLPGYFLRDRWEAIERGLNKEKVPYPAFMLEGTTSTPAVEGQPVVGRQEEQVPADQTENIRTTIVNSPIIIDDETTSLGKLLPFWARNMVDKSGRLLGEVATSGEYNEKELFAAMDLPFGDDKGAEGLKEITRRMAAQLGVDESDPQARAAAIKALKSLKAFYENTDAITQLQEYRPVGSTK